MYEAIGVKNIDQILPPPAEPSPMDPATENILAMSGKPFQAFKGQDHQAHITTHLNFMATNIARNSPPVMAALEKNIFEHISKTQCPTAQAAHPAILGNHSKNSKRFCFNRDSFYKL